jgi:glycosyltransferase involved in cell wall biosynthesis
MAKIILLSPFFDPALAFQEWVMAKCLVRLGHSVTVAYARHRAEMKHTTPADDVKRQEILAQFPGITLHRVASFGGRHTVLPISGRRMRALCAGQDLAIINGPGHGFGYRTLRMVPRSLKALVMFGDLLDNRRHMRPVIRRWKDRWYRWLFERADKLTYNTPECLEILREAGLGKHEERITLAGLPYDEDFFHLSEAGAAPRPPDALRTLTTITRTLAHKPFDQWLPPVFAFLRAHPGWRYVFAGMGTDSTAQRIRELVAESGLADRIELLGMQDQAGMCRLYNEADLGLFPRATIGIQQAMATGLPVILPQRGTVSHLVQEGNNGYYYEGLENAAAVLAKAAAHTWPERCTLAQESRRWSGMGYTRLLMEGLV